MFFWKSKSNPCSERTELNLLQKLELMEKYQQVPPVDVVGFAKELNITVKFEDLDDNVYGYLEKVGENYKIGVNKDHSFFEKKFTIAHEIAHWWFHRDYADCSYNNRITDWVKRDKNLPNDVSYSDERLANGFAMELLMPADFIGEQIDWHGVKSAKKLAEMLEVSMNAINQRLDKLGFKLDP